MLEDLEGNYERSSQRCNTQGSYQGLSGSASKIYNNTPSPLAIYTTRLATRSNLYYFGIANFIAPIYNRTNKYNNDYKDNTTIGNSIVTKYCRYLLSSILLPIIDLVLPSYLPKFIYLQVVVSYIVGILGYKYILYQYYIKNS